MTARDNRLFVEAVLPRYRVGIPWRDLPAKFGDFRVIHTRLIRWSKAGVWERLFEVLQTLSDKPEDMSISIAVRAIQQRNLTGTGLATP